MDKNLNFAETDFRVPMPIFDFFENLVCFGPMSVGKLLEAHSQDPGTRCGATRAVGEHVF